MKKIIYFLVALGIILPTVVFADALGSGLLEQSVGGVGLESDVETSVANIIAGVLAVTGTVFLILTVAAGIMWMTASGNEDKITKAKKILTGATIGLAICLFAYMITFFVTSSISGSECQGSCVPETSGCSSGFGEGTCASGEVCCK